jgi:hypothetical protein
MAWNPQQTLSRPVRQVNHNRSTTITTISVTRYLGPFYRFG